MKIQVALLAVLAGTLPGVADDYTWNRADGGDLALSDNWGGGGVNPSETDTALVVLEQSSPLTLASASVLTVYNLSLSANLELALGDGHVLTADNRVFFNGAGREFLLSSGTLRTLNDRMFMGDGANDRGNVLTVAGRGTLCSVANYFSLSPNAGPNRLVIRDGATFEGSIQVSANTTTASGNEIVVTGEGTTYRVTNDNTLRLAQGSDNVFAVSNKATASFVGSAKWASVRVGIYYNLGAGDRNRVLVDDATLMADYGIWIGENSSSNTFEIANGGRVFAQGDIQLGRSRDAADTTHPNPIVGNRLLVRGLGNYLYTKSGVAVGYGAESCENAFEIPADAGLTYCGPLSMGCDAANVGNRVTVGGTLTVTNAATAYWDIGHASTGNVFSVAGAAARAAFENTTVRIGATASASNNVFCASDGAQVMLTKNASLTTVGCDGLIRFDNAELVDDGTAKVVVDGGSSADARGTGGRLELVNGAVFGCARLILGDYSRDTRLDISNATLRVANFQPNFKDLTDSNCQIRFLGDNPRLEATNLNFFGDATYNFHIPREGYELTNPDQSVVTCGTVTRRDNAKKTGRPLIRVMGEEGPRTRGHWTLMKVTNDKWNFTNAEAGNNITVDDIDCGPGIRAVVTEKTIEVYVRSQRGTVVIIR